MKQKEFWIWIFGVYLSGIFLIYRCQGGDNIYEKVHIKKKKVHIIIIDCDCDEIYSYSSLKI